MKITPPPMPNPAGEVTLRVDGIRSKFETVFTQDQLTARDQAWQELVQPLVDALRLIAAQDQGCGGTVSEVEAWRLAKLIAFDTLSSLTKE